MARVYAQLHHDMWKPGDFRGLTPNAKLVYLALMSQPGISSAGVLPLNPQRLSTITGVPSKDLGKALTELEDGRFIVTDEEESEVLVRTYIKWDRPHKSPNGLKGLRKAIEIVASVRIKAALRSECDRVGVAWEFTNRDGDTVHLEDPFQDLPEALVIPLRSPLEDTSAAPSKGRGSGSGSGSGSGTRARNARFEEFWEIYPRRVAKPEAEKAWAKAVSRADPDVILAGTRRYRDDPNREQPYTAHPSTWLNQDRWNDDPLPAKGAERGGKSADMTSFYAELNRG